MFFASKEIQQQIRAQNMERYGVPHHMMVPEMAEKVRETNRKLYGYAYAMNKPEVYEKIRVIHIEKHGVPFPLQSKEIQNKITATCLEKYGVERPALSEEIIKKMHKLKDFVFPSGRTVQVMGYEPRALSFLLQLYPEEDLLLRSDIPVIPYTLDGKPHKYFADVFVRSDNCLIEVKSPYTLTCDLDKNIAKFEGVCNAGYKCRLLVFEAKGNTPAIDVYVE